jgi:hypothetical protein
MKKKKAKRKNNAPKNIPKINSGLKNPRAAQIIKPDENKITDAAKIIETNKTRELENPAEEIDEAKKQKPILPKIQEEKAGDKTETAKKSADKSTKTSAKIKNVTKEKLAPELNVAANEKNLSATDDTENLTEEELETKIRQYFSLCEERGAPRTISGLCCFLDVDKEKFWRLAEAENSRGARKKALRQIEQWIEENSIVGKISSSMAMFELRSNFGWTEKPAQTTNADSPAVVIIDDLR